jgi:hypothetical protein
VHWKNIGIFLTGAWAKTFAVIIAKIARHIASLFISFSHTVGGWPIHKFEQIPWVPLTCPPIPHG